MAQLAQVHHTARLTLRAFDISDLDDLAGIYEHEQVNRYLYWEPRSRDESLAALKRCLARPPEVIEDNVLPVAVVLRNTTRVIGDFLLRWERNVHRQGEIGGSLHPDFQGHGYASEIYLELLDIAFGEFELHRVIGRTDARNSASVRSLEKAGLHQEAHLIENEFVKGEWTDEIIMAIRRSEWESLQAPRGI
jgi:RimJ/RimL family protein N-acetyltransferase